MEKDPVLITAYSLSEFYAAQHTHQTIQPYQAKGDPALILAMPSVYIFYP